MDTLHLKFLDKGTNLNISTVMNELLPEDEFKATLYDLVSDLSFFADGESLHKACQGLTGTAYLKISFFRNGNLYSFNGKVKDTLVRSGRPLTHIDQISAIEVATRRMSPRHDISVRVDIRPLAEAAKGGGDILFSGHTFDISNEGLCVLSNNKIGANLGDIVQVEFKMNRMDRFSIPSKFVRSGNAPQSVQYKHDYGFLFDFAKAPEEKTRLNTSIFKHKQGGM